MLELITFKELSDCGEPVRDACIIDGSDEITLLNSILSSSEKRGYDEIDIQKPFGGYAVAEMNVPGGIKVFVVVWTINGKSHGICLGRGLHIVKTDDITPRLAHHEDYGAYMVVPRNYVLKL